ncbi:carbohydrate ABC transporter membrane protein 1 (CUT1 family) [Halanaerobium saccharolyticum]|uniref:Carbohydrate ABC transporter membrane protein 1 (CUT1 family) n=1 Tax=Halanaerobium saccharolyticum TaxID=43595 RepID=A0A4R7YZ66_9FIRM|nr:sugar ABC transporter permease [Halanaerobium saccharolyticum]RAK12727.1 carbohydrate ABC transporter membrane protein 1 (CUT1 family) [Halanaerobium saccharolyticum]TDW02940.1 carbohydrate ABC transporter membrane protein 1 (CUT1 family) [Halanaerobium saccharolyticum]TDX62876.1 carbohydrate ABC transporter membrane protein 1 (CUT1 family) [Halanaerobium saccharolyticum]
MKIKDTWQEMKENRHFYYFLVPFLLFFSVFMLFPILFSFYMSLHRWGGLGEATFTGLKNYSRILTDSTFHTALYNTTFMWLTSTPLILGFALILAVMLNKKEVKFLKYFRVGYFMPFVTSTVVVGVIFTILLDGSFGLVNFFIESIGFDKIRFLTSTTWSKISIVIVLTWRWVGYNTIIMLAGLQNIPEDLYEAAEIDGGSTLQKFFYITVPMMRPIILFTFILSTIGSFQIFTEPYIMTGGGPMQSSLSVVQYLYNSGFQQFRMGYASALSYVLFAIIFVASYFQIKIGSGEEGI